MNGAERLEHEGTKAAKHAKHEVSAAGVYRGRTGGPAGAAPSCASRFVDFVSFRDFVVQISSPQNYESHPGSCPRSPSMLDYLHHSCRSVFKLSWARSPTEAQPAAVRRPCLTKRGL